MPKPTSIRLEDHHADLLEALAQIEGLSLSDVIRDAVEDLIKARLADDSLRQQVDEVVTERQQQRLAKLRDRYLEPMPTIRRDGRAHRRPAQA